MQVTQFGFSSALKTEVTRGVRLAIILRLTAILLIALWITERVGYQTAWYYLAILGLLLASGFVQWRYAPQTGTIRHVVMACLILFDMGAVTYALVVPPPGTPDIWPAAMQLRLGNFDYFYVFIALATLAYSPLLSAWTGIAAIIAWTIGTIFVGLQAGSFTVLEIATIRQMPTVELVDLLLDPNYVSIVLWAQEVMLAIVISVILAATAFRARLIAFKQATAAAERSNLSRYFSPHIAQELATQPQDLRTVQEHEVAVIFCDIIGFTRFSEINSADEVIALLRETHGRLARTVFAHQGTVDKYIGDSLMATFGTPRPKKDDAARALRTVFELNDAVEQMNKERRIQGRQPIQVGIGLHVGRAVIGNIGDSTMLEFAVVGDTVNVASRLETATRALNACLVVSEDAVSRAQAQDPSLASLITRLAHAEPLKLKNREAAVSIRYLARTDIAMLDGGEKDRPER